jgi:dihydrofolate synthase/folylpolyglutamate synthase
MEDGYRVGLYTSPHLFSFRERIRINGEPIGEEDVARLIEKIAPHAEEMKKKNNRPTYFEISTMMAFLYFKEKEVEFMILEVGMGGRLDSTNIAESLISVITPISYDHTQYLGSTLREIAYEKCGIIKNDSVVISSPQQKEAMDVIEQVSREKNSKLYVVGKDIFLEFLHSDLESQNFRLLTRHEEFPYLKINLLGDFQLENAATAVEAVEELRSKGIFVSGDAVRNGLAKARWPGRLQIVHKRPFIIVDGAQDVNSVLRLKKAVKDIFRYKRLILIFGAMQDKDIKGMCKELSDTANWVLPTKSKSERACPPKIIEEEILKHNREIELITTGSLAEAVNKAKEKAKAEDLILITGSLYIVAEAMKELAHR